MGRHSRKDRASSAPLPAAEQCGRRIFTERLPNTVKRYGRQTCRLSTALEQITLALGGSAGSRLAEQLGILASGSTLLRGLRKKARADTPISPRIVGIDDWAWRKGQRYGTILCDLERGKVIDLLPDRSAESAAAWLRAHPGIEIVSRDRASLYAEAVEKAVPHAVQVADRWHLLRNLSEALIGALAPHHRLMTEAARAVLRAPEAPIIETSARPGNATRAEDAKQRSRDRRMARSDSVMEQVRNGLSQAEISRTLGIDRRTIRHWIRARNFPERKPVFRASSVEEYRPSSTGAGKKAVIMPASCGARCVNVGSPEGIALFATGSGSITGRKLRESVEDHSLNHRRVSLLGKQHGRY